MYDVIIIGAGPAGCSAAINLQPDCRVAVIDSNQQAIFKIGESLPPASKRLFQDMGLWEEFLQQDHLPCYGNRAIWASNIVEETDFIRDIDGHGWHLDRQKFEQWLRDKTKQLGCDFYTSSPFETAQCIDNIWHCVIQNEQESKTLKSKIIIDASGRQSIFSRQQKIQRQHYDKMTCQWIKGTETPCQSDAGFSFIQATDEGWWYSAAIPGNQRILAFHTDAKVKGNNKFKNPQQLLDKAQTVKELAAILKGSAFKLSTETGFTAAHSSRLSQFSGDNWCAIGDAAMCMDPISSQGMFNGLYTGLLAAKETKAKLSSHLNDYAKYNDALEHIWFAYQTHLKYWYQTSTLWPKAPFWQQKAIE